MKSSILFLLQKKPFFAYKIIALSTRVRKESSEKQQKRKPFGNSAGPGRCVGADIHANMPAR
ncbi:MAG TPA: hypothetical protein H9795_08035 [Candidatus Fournierella merdigallinarum]|nr:hypothetical protein [Candidatus Fournierella merdigallinarum]